MLPFSADVRLPETYRSLSESFSTIAARPMGSMASRQTSLKHPRKVDYS
jgi:hypothetical protein